MQEEYNASSIKILDGVELAEIPYMKILETVRKYKKPEEIVSCAYEACMLAGLSFDDFYIAKYCKGEEVPKNAEFLEIYDDLRNNRQTNRELKQKGLKK